MSNRKMQNPFAALRDLDVDEPDFVFAPSRLNNAAEQLATSSVSTASASSNPFPSSTVVSLSSSLSLSSSDPSTTTTNSSSVSVHTLFTKKVDLLGITSELEKALQDSDESDDDEENAENSNNDDDEYRNTVNDPNELNGIGNTPGGAKNSGMKTKKSLSTDKAKQRKAFDFSSFSKIATETAEEIEQREAEERQRQLEMERTLTNRLEEMYAREKDEFKEKISRMDLSSKHRQRRLQAGDAGKTYSDRQGAKVMKRNEARKRLNKAKNIY